jgi:hypothetical protein
LRKTKGSGKSVDKSGTNVGSVFDEAWAVAARTPSANKPKNFT